MNALTIVVTVLSATVTISAIEVTPISYGSYKNPSTCRTAEPFGATALDRTDSDGEGCTCSGSWQPQCCCPRPRPHSQLPTCTRTCTCRPSCPSGGPRPSVSGPSPTDLAGFVSPPQRPLLLPKLIPVMLKPLSFDVHRPSVPSYGLGSGYGGPAPSLPSQCGCGCPPSSPYEEFYKFNDK
ncbi:uncharacterized protein LOC112595881 [Melanaphis sacchari]|uniref:uncharacterized protein LOC112595881 n=1 Tax=Melanaphis sacchari TaxID=742174 RepID=UPI000DC14A1F|nr:uncharacterized protein LOC112595881 [Melanaphis sacchari]